MLIYGGTAVNGNPPDPEIYDPATNLWAVASTAGATLLPPPSQVLLANGSYLDFNHSNNQVFLVDPVARTSTQTGSLVTPRTGFYAVLLRNGKVLLGGGVVTNFGTARTNKAELYDPATGMWTATGDAFYARDTATATLLPDGRVLVSGGYGGSGPGGRRRL